ncbi:MAG: helix-turn-helix domain-containing protein [Chloroflexi bacterium]|nr:helix-turn-helix domain-containing protein [Chloroflexota bacterium]
MEAKEYLTTEEVARELGISVFTVRRYVRNGILRAVKLEGAYRIRRRDFEEFLKRRETDAKV